MRMVSVRLVLAVSIWATVSVADSASLSPTDGAAELRKITAMDLLLLRDIGSSDFGKFSVSPNGDRLAFQLTEVELESNSLRTSWVIAETKPGRSLVDAGDGGEPIFFRNTSGIRVGSLSAENSKWSPDGNWIFYRLKKDGAIQLWRSNADGTVQEQLTANPADVESFMLASDGRRIFFQVNRTRAEKAAIDKEQGERGYLFDSSFLPYYAPRPLWGACPPGDHWSRMPESRACSLSLWVFDLETEAERRATEQDLEEYAKLQSPDKAAGSSQDHNVQSVHRSSDGARVAWLVNEDPETFPGPGAPLTVFVAAPDRIRCPAAECTGRFSDLWWDEETGELYLMRREGVASSEHAFYGWKPGDKGVRTIHRTTDLISDCQVVGRRAICLHEGPTSPRRIIALDLTNGRTTTLVDPNTDYRNIQFTKVERLEWQDGFGNETFGHLVYPANYREGTRYPLVIVQYYSRGFLRGGTGDEYPIHLLAANGFAVLSFDRPNDWRQMGKISFGMEWEKKEWKDSYEKRRALTALEVIIDRLDAQGIIDPAQVGITGLSDGAETLYYSLIHTDRFAAASASSGSWEQVLYYLSGETYLREYLPSVGLGRPGGPEDRYWSDHAVSLNASSINAPLLINSSDHELTGLGIETYISLKEADKPVEMHVFPNEYHVKWQPKHRYNIYRSNVQWFNFWLRGVEEPDPVDPEQYIRWRQLREQHQANQRALEQVQTPEKKRAGAGGSLLFRDRLLADVVAEMNRYRTQ